MTSIKWIALIKIEFSFQKRDLVFRWVFIEYDDLHS